MHSTDGRRRRVRAMPLFTDARRPAALPRLWRCAWRRAPARRDNHARKEARRRRPCATVRCTSSGQLGMHTRSRALSVTFLYPPRRSNATCTGSDETLRTALCSRLVAAGSSPPPRPCPCGAARCTKSITRHDTALSACGGSRYVLDGRRPALVLASCRIAPARERAPRHVPCGLRRVTRRQWPEPPLRSRWWW